MKFKEFDMILLSKQKRPLARLFLVFHSVEGSSPAHSWYGGMRLKISCQLMTTLVIFRFVEYHL